MLLGFSVSAVLLSLQCVSKEALQLHFRISARAPGVGQICTSSHDLGTENQGLLCFPCCMEEHTNDSTPPVQVFRKFLPPGVIPDSQSFGSSSIGHLLDFLSIFRTNTNLLISDLLIFCTFSSYLGTSLVGCTD